jgi:hypothetical protein
VATDTVTDIEFALLCSSATYRDGLLSVLEAGLEEFHAPALPAVIQPWLVFKVSFAPEDVDQVQLVRACVDLEDDATEPERLADVGFSLQAAPAEGALSVYVMAIHRLTLQVRRPGVYVVNLSINGEHRRRIHSRSTANCPRCDVPDILGYAWMRMAQRGITEADVVAALEHEVAPPRPGNRPGRLVRCGLDAQGRKLEVVLNDHGQVVNAFRPRS